MSKHSIELTQIVSRFRSQTIGVLGDFMLDELMRGEASRISPEAPVPVVAMEIPVERYPGGGGNVAANVASLGARAVPFGATGKDDSAKHLRGLLKARRISPETLIEDSERVTPRKVRIVAHQHQLLRLDFENPAPLSSKVSELLARQLTRWMGRLNALIISDYQKGSVTTSVCAQAVALARQQRVPVLVDPKPEHPEICRHATVVTPNLREAELLAGRPLRRPEELMAGGRRLRAELDCTNLLITRGIEGMTLFEEDGSTFEIKTVPRPVYDVTGAGDTVIAVLALALSSGANIRQAAQLANLAGGRVVLKFGTAELAPSELLEAISQKKD